MALRNGWVVCVLVALSLAGCLQPGSDGDAGEVHLVDVAPRGGSGLDYARVPSETKQRWDVLRNRSSLSSSDLLTFPTKHTGAPGVALSDFDGDDDLDVFVPNGPGAAHSLFANRLSETGELVFEDVARQVGVAAPGQDGTGVCFGDTDNDGDEDLLVLSRLGRHRFFENRLVESGEARFENVTSETGLRGGRGATACSLGDVDADGRLDLVVANTHRNWSKFFPVFPVPMEELEPNDLYLNAGGNRFRDVSDASGIRNLSRLPPGTGSITWAIAMVDYDRDGDVDVFQADDQGGMASREHGGVDRGLVQVLDNDGTGNFTAVTVKARTDTVGGYMGLAFADYDRDGRLDFFQTNLGDYFPRFPPPKSYDMGSMASDWFLGQRDGSFFRPGTGDLEGVPFGWGTTPMDLDNDGDTDVVYHGGMAMTSVAVLDNPGVVLENDGSATFRYADEALAGPTNHTYRAVEGVASGDLDRDGFPDVVSVSGFDVAPGEDLKPFPTSGGPFDATARYARILEREGDRFRWEDFRFERGSLAVEVSEGNANGWIAVRTRGTADVLPDGSNLDGIGAVVSVTPEGGETAMRPVVGGSSYASQNALSLTFGLGSASSADVEVLWPGGTLNVLHDVAAGERIAFPQIPCSLDGEFASRAAFRACVEDATSELRDAGVVSERLAGRLTDSMVSAFGGSDAG